MYITAKILITGKMNVTKTVNIFNYQQIIYTCLSRN